MSQVLIGFIVVAEQRGLGREQKVWLLLVGINEKEDADD